MMVAVALFAVVMTVSVGALLALVDANRKAQALQSVMNNLNVALDGMVRNIRMGVSYHCGDASETNKTALSTRSDCVSGGELIAFEAFGNSSSDTGDQWVYWFQDGRIWKSENARDTALPITAPEVEIDSFDVFVTGAEGVLNTDGDTTQPKVVFSIQGTAGAQDSTFSVVGTAKRIRTTFNIQAVASQRLLDL
jgi:type II secretory pathway pseudopilin PulG